MELHALPVPTTVIRNIDQAPLRSIPTTHSRGPPPRGKPTNEKCNTEKNQTAEQQFQQLFAALDLSSSNGHTRQPLQAVHPAERRPASAPPRCAMHHQQPNTDPEGIKRPTSPFTEQPISTGSTPVPLSQPTAATKTTPWSPPKSQKKARGRGKAKTFQRLAVKNAKLQSRMHLRLLVDALHLPSSLGLFIPT